LLPSICDSCRSRQQSWFNGFERLEHISFEELLTTLQPYNIREALFHISYSCPNLLSLHINKCRQPLLDDAITCLVTSCPKLASLSLLECNITDRSLEALGKFSVHLTNLNLSQCDAINDQGIFALAQGCPLLQILNLNYCDLITDKSIMFLVTKCLHLKSLSLFFCMGLSEGHLYPEPKKNLVEVFRKKVVVKE